MSSENEKTLEGVKKTLEDFARDKEGHETEGQRDMEQRLGIDNEESEDATLGKHNSNAWTALQGKRNTPNAI